MQVGNEFECFMRVDANTRGHLQWFYFKMFNLKKDETYKLNICNFHKAKSLYTRGMRPFLFSHRANEEQPVGWQQGGQNIEYSRSRPKVEEALLGKEEREEEEKKYYSLSFEISSSYEDDIFEVAYCPPYTYTKLNTYLRSLMGIHYERNILGEETLCNSLGGIKIPILNLSNDVSEGEAQFKQGRTYKNKHLIFVMCRIHPGEANSSYVL